jgi:SEC-C motif-containing protein
MRSRYTAYCLARGDYLWATWHHTTRRQNLDLDAGVNWLGLKIVHTESGGPKESAGLVEFVARYRIGGRPHRLHVIGRFSRRDGRRLHRDGEVQP